jgi:hypothetical protein
MTGTNCETMPDHTARAIGDGTPMMLSAIHVAMAENVASTTREYR